MGTSGNAMPSTLITGANRGHGLEFARQYAAEGCKVALFQIRSIGGSVDPAMPLTASSVTLMITLTQGAKKKKPRT